ncbi:hypothetical protein F5B22DRAFT_653774 [Xylaria bambusicola]|uniref:uncharacterized protein n=1 Tax=Xylaria bambusicola TaxID=326684 RepID=UPI00200745C1|nr:uncharacterized protein F5B22DRAFT_653774 [Xylaria bambusicola]KAI0520828.1 hypothetical protein F5B22DRAFT_653774 [Xylaria bambusicola]
MALPQSLPDPYTLFSSVDRSSIRHSAPPALPGSGIREILRREKSGGYPHNFQDSQRSVTPDEYGSGSEDEDARDRDIGHIKTENKPSVRANSKRRRSAAPTPGPETRQRSLSRTAISTPLYLPEDSSDRDVSTCSESYFTLSRTSSNLESPKRGRTTRRDPTPYPENVGRDRSRLHRVRSNISIQRRVSHDERDPEKKEYSPRPSGTGGSLVDTSLRIIKGAFQLHRCQRPDKFRFPKPSSQPETVWRPGDGFSEDEARPQFPVHVMKKLRRKRTRSLPALGQLPLISKSIDKDSTEKTTSSRPWKSVKMTKESWPTRDNFMEIPVNRKAITDIIESSSMIEPTVLQSPRTRATSRPKMKQVVPLKRRASYFENFGRHKGKSQSRHRRKPSLSITKVPYDYGSQTSNDIGLYKQAGEGSAEQDALNEDGNDVQGSLELGYDNPNILNSEDVEQLDGLEHTDLEDPDEHIQSTVPDSQPGEVYLGGFYSGQTLINTSDLVIMAHMAID